MLVIVVRNELRDVQTAHTQAVEHTTHQGDVIQQLQTLQMDTQKGLSSLKTLKIIVDSLIRFQIKTP